MRINGVNGLACKILVKNLRSDSITVEPILGLPVIKDLIVDMKPFFDHYKSVMPFLVNDDPAPTTERLQSPAERARYDDTTKCILCACCTTACPPFWGDRKYVGPAAIVNAHRFIFDSRDRAAADRLEILNDAEGRLALPHRVQLHQRLPARHQGHAGDPGGQARLLDRRGQH